MTKIFHELGDDSSFPQYRGKVFLVGCGLGDPEQLTLRAHSIIINAQIVLYDNLISDEILSLVPATARKFYVGKAKQQASVPQERINQLIADFADQGYAVVRLKSGDPYIFGRGAEEALHLRSQGIDVEVIPGISSSIAAAGCAGIAPTVRGYSSGLSVVTAHVQNGKFNTEWLPLLNVPNHTVVILMGLTLAGKISYSAIRSGIKGKTSVAIVSNASRPNQTTVVTNLRKLPSAARNVEGPAVIVIGEVVRLHGLLPVHSAVETALQQAG